MNRKFMLLAASTILLSGCAEDAFVDNTESQPTTELQEIQLSVAQPEFMAINTRGAGMIGGIEGTDANKWSNQTISIFALRLNTAPYLNNEKAKVTSVGPKNASITWDNAQEHYYPMQGAYKFFGVYADDATVGSTAAEDGSVSMNVTYNGTQDIMIADAALTASDKQTLAQSINLGDKVDQNGEFVAGATDEDKSKIHAEYAKSFSAYTARRHVQPELVFKHQLAHLNFYVKAGNQNAAKESKTIDGQSITKGVYVQSVTIKDVVNKATIGISPVNGISFTPSTAAADKTNFVLYQSYEDDGQGNMQNKTLDPTASTWDGNQTVSVKIGQGMLVTPGVNQYLADVVVFEPVDQTYNPVPQTEQNKTYENVAIACKDSEGNPIAFEAGKTYDVTITVYSKEQITVTATLTGWQQGGSISVSPEDDSFTN